VLIFLADKFYSIRNLGGVLVKENRYCNQYLDEDYMHLVVEYRGDFEVQINKISYACGSAIINFYKIFENMI
jgi:hypothetical protein